MASIDCNPSAIVEVNRQGALRVNGTRCSHHGLDCQKATTRLYVLIAIDDSATEWNRVMTWKEICDEQFQDHHPLSSFTFHHASILTCEPLETGLRVRQSSTSSRTLTLEDLMTKMSLVDGPRRSVKNPVEVSVVRKTFSRAKIQWKSCGKRPNQWLIVITRINDASKTAVAYFYVKKKRYWYFNLPLTLEVGAEYRVEVKALQKVVGNDSYLYVNAEGTAQFRADLTLRDLNTRYQQAVSYSQSNRWNGLIGTPCNWFYRNKPYHYFDDVMHRRRGLMEVYIKDGRGDRASPINWKLKGLFFMARNENGFPPPESPFGPWRLQISPILLLSMAPNMYFANFFCMKGKTHRITLVLTRYRSVADEFCRNNLLPLDINENPFLFQYGMGLYTANSRLLDIEVFFTENIDVNFMLQMRLGGFSSRCPIPMNCKGRSSPQGTPKNPPCKHCNIRSPISSKFSTF